MKLYEQFSGEQLKIAEKIQQRRLQMLVHSYLYYEKDTNLVSDSVWSAWAKELEHLQNTYPELSNAIIYADAFKDWDGSSGAFLPYMDDNIVATGQRLLKEQKPVLKKPEKVKPVAQQFSLF